MRMLSPMKAVLIGNYGVGNLGDEALREYFLRRMPDVEWIVLSASPKAGEYARLPLGIRSFFATNWIRTLGAIRRSDAVVFGGGSLLTDTESLRACFLWGLHALVARMFHRPLLLAFQGVGPFRTRAGERIARAVCRWAAFVSVRDAASAERLQKWGLGCTVSFDPILALPQRQRCPGCAEDFLVLVPRFNSDAAFVAACAKAVEEHPGTSIEIWLFEPGNGEELRLGELLAERFTGVVRRMEHVADILARLPHVRHLVTQRYHGAVFAMAAGCPVTLVEQRKGDKIWELRTATENGLTLLEVRNTVEHGECELRRALAMAN